jgi:two-component system, chemotaxis family, sensor kinase Cph1
MTTQSEGAASEAHLSACSRETIYTPGRIQSHGVLLALSEPDWIVLQGSANAEEWFGRPPREPGHLGEFIGRDNLERIRSGLLIPPEASGTHYLGTVTSTARPGRFHAVAHRHGGLLIIELERIESGEEPAVREFFRLLRSTRNVLLGAANIDELSRSGAREVRDLTGFDRVLVYRFDENWNGHVIAENQRPDLPSYLDLWFPSSDIPEQARELYRINPIRVIANVNDETVPIVPELTPGTGLPLDLSCATLRAVSPLDIEYLKNMGVTASMCISILREGKLWGLIVCHHTSPRAPSFEVRTACDLIAQAFSAQLSTLERAADFEHRMRLKLWTTRLLSSMAQEKDFVDGLTCHPDDLMSFLSADGAAVMFEGRCMLLGNAPPEDQVMSITEWLVQEGRPDVFHTDCLPDILPGGEAIRGQASGVLAISISKIHRSYVLWFRPEAVQTVKWSGDPSIAVDTNGDGSCRLHPRKSFEEWKQTVRGRSLAWKQAEIDTAGELRNAIVGIVLRNAEQMAGLSAELQRSNTELEAFSYSVSHDLRAPFRHIAGFAELLREHLGESLDARGARYVDTIIDSAQSAGALVDHLLSYSRIGRAKLYRGRVDMKRLVGEVIQEIEIDLKDRRIEWKVGELPAVRADPSMMRVVMMNLLSNAAKYTRGRDSAVVEVAAETRDCEVVFCVSDNGVGFDQKYVDKLFGVFQRLHREEDYEGSGIGLANVRRIIARHGGRTWARGQAGSGASIWFSLPLELSDVL